MKLRLYYVTAIKNINSILDNGITPGLDSDSEVGLFFHSRFPEEVLFFNSKAPANLEGRLPVVVEVNADIDDCQLLSINKSRILGDMGSKSYFDGDPVVILGKIKPEDVKEIFYLDQTSIRDYIETSHSSPLLTAYS